MSYITQQQLTDRYGERLLVQGDVADLLHLREVVDALPLDPVHEEVDRGLACHCFTPS